jgi:S1-C subfamily serine protease
VNLLDLVIVVALGSAALGGYRLGFVARAASWVGLGLGIYLAVRFLPTIVRAFNDQDPSSKLLVALLVLVGGAFAGQALGLLAGSALRRFVPLGPVRALDSAVGAVVGMLGVLLLWWLLLPSMAEVPGSLARQVRNSAIARAIDTNLPEPPDTLQALRRLVGDVNFPQVFQGLRPAPEVGAPPAGTTIPPAVLQRVSASTVKVAGVACDRIQEGSGFAAAPDMVVTNAHVVAGQLAGRTEVVRPDGRRLRAAVVVFDADRDLAVLRVPGLRQAPLPVGIGRVGADGAVFGHPGGQAELRIAPAAVRQQVQALGRDLYDAHPTRRDVYILAAQLRPGDSGGALVNPAGAVMGVAFAIAPDRPGTAYALTTRELSAALAAPRGGAVGTGPCLTRA